MGSLIKIHFPSYSWTIESPEATLTFSWKSSADWSQSNETIGQHKLQKVRHTEKFNGYNGAVQRFQWSIYISKMTTEWLWVSEEKPEGILQFIFKKEKKERKTNTETEKRKMFKSHSLIWISLRFDDWSIFILKTDWLEEGRWRR